MNSLTQSRWFLLQGSCSGTQGLCLDVRARVLRAVAKEYMLGLLTSFFCKIPFGPGWRSVTRPRVTARGPRAFVRPALALALGAQLVSCGRSNHETSEGFPRAETLYVGGRQWGEPSSFNPLSGSPDWPAKEWHTLLYESLFYFNSREGKLSPLLGQSYKVTDDTVEVTLDPAARWNDGKPLTAWDVKYTYNLGQKYRGLQVSPLWQYITEVQVPDAAGATEPGTVNASAGGAPRKIVFVLDKTRKNPLVVLDALQEIRIVPRHVLEPLFASVKGDLNEFLKSRFDKDPVGSGPYRLLSYSSEKIAAVRDDTYWGNAVLHQGKLPAPKYIVHPIYKSNDHFSVALQQGRLDASASFIPRIWLKQRKGVGSWYDKEPYFVPASMPMFFINVTHRPVSDVRLRRAMAEAIDYKDIRELAVSGYSAPIKPGLILPFGLESKYFSEEDAQKYGAWFNPQKAKADVWPRGYVPEFGPNGELVQTKDAQGNRVPTFYIKSPTGWSDWESIVRIAVKSMR